MTATPTVKDLDRADWLYRYKRKIVLSTFVILACVIAVTMASISVTLRSRLIHDSKVKTEELAEVIELSLRSLMLERNPGKIQETLGVLSAGGSSIDKAFILDKNGRVAYSSSPADIGMTIDRFRDRSCSGCHTRTATFSHETTTIVTVEGRELLRSVNIIDNDKSCHGCHPASDRAIGKLIIDQSIQPTYGLITTVELILAVAGLFCLFVLAPFLSRVLSKGIDKYISEILFKSSELAMLYMIVERLSKTIELEDLKRVVIDIIRELYSADEVHIILQKDGPECGGIAWKKADDKIDRRVAPAEDPYRELIHECFQGTLDQAKIIEDGRSVAVPLQKGGACLGLIIATRSDRKFDAHDLELVRAMGSHIAVALENATLYRIAITDELTGLYSKRHFRTVIENKFQLYEKYGEKLSLLILDIDNFKKVNDTYGHPAGDIVLRDVARRIMNTTREGDLDFRYGGEEFIALLPATDSSAGVYVAERIREQINSAVFDIGEQQLPITVSIGVASIPEHALTIRDLVSEADKALYTAKKAGKNRVVLSSTRTG